MVGGGSIGAVIISIGFLAKLRVRHVRNRSSVQVRLVILSALAGVAIGVVHMGTNLVLASLDPDVPDAPEVRSTPHTWERT